MRFTIEGFSQERAVELGLTAEDLVILRWFVDFWPSPKMIKMEHEGKTYALVSYAGFIEQMPIIGCNKRTIARKFQRLVEAKVLENVTIKQGGSFSVYRFGTNYDSLVSKSATVVQTCAEGCTEENRGLYENEQPPMYGNVHTKTNPYNATNQLNESNILGKSKEEKSSCPYDSFRDTYNNICTSLSSVRILTDKRKKAIKAFLKDFTLDQFREICIKANASGFLTGQNDRAWKADFDFLLRPDKAAKILEGGYDNGDRKQEVNNVHSSGLDESKHLWHGRKLPSLTDGI